MKIRGLTKKDYQYIVAVIDRWWGGPSAERAHPVFFYELGQEALVAESEDDGELIGFLLGFVAPTDPPTGYVHMVGIHPDHRRRGVGARLYQHFEGRCRATGAACIKAITYVGNDGSVQFHEALGFSAEVVSDYAGEGRPRLVFTKAL